MSNERFCRRRFLGAAPILGGAAVILNMNQIQGQSPNAADARFRVMGNRVSVFYSPFLGLVAGGFLKAEGLDPTYDVLGTRDTSAVLKSGDADVVQGAVSTNWTAAEAGKTDLPAHIAQINQHDGFFLLRRGSETAFEWKQLEGKALLADHGGQPLIMLRYGLNYNKVDWSKIRVIDAGSPTAMYNAFRSGMGDYVHMQGAAPQQLELDGVGKVVASFGESTPPVAFSSVVASRDFVKTPKYQAFLRAFAKSKMWAQQAPPREIAEKQASYFPDLSVDALTRAIARYQAMGTWATGLDIPRDQYEQAWKVFSWAGAVKRPHAYEEVCIRPATV